MKRFALALLLPIFSFAYEENNAPPSSFSRPPEKEITVEAQPWVENCIAEPYVEADFLYWKVKQEGYGLGATGVGDINFPINYKGRVPFPKFEGAPGFRVALGFNFAHDGWDALLRYSWIYSRASKTYTPGSGEVLQGIWFIGPDSLFQRGIEKTSGRWNVHFNTVDFEWGRNFYLSRFSSMRPFFGLKGFWMDQDFSLRQVGVATNQQLSTQNTRLDNDIWGIGIRFGLNTTWYFVKNWSVFADFAFSNAWSRFDVARKDAVEVIATGESTTVFDVAIDEYYMIPILELGTGVRWEMWFADDSMHALIQAGWEEQIWWDANRALIFGSNDQGEGNFYTQGLTLRFRFDF